MNKLITFLISGYIGGAVCLFIHLKFLHLFFKFISSSNVYNDAYTTGYMLGMAIV